MLSRKEVAIMRQAHHPNIVRLKDVYEGTTKIYVIADLLKGGDMHYCLEEQPDYHYGEIPCVKIVKQMLSAVEFLHSKNVFSICPWIQSHASSLPLKVKSSP